MSQTTIAHYKDMSLSEEQHDQIAEVALEIQAHYEHDAGMHYKAADIESALYHWLGLCIENLIEEMAYHVATGNRDLSMNREVFINRLSKCPVAYTPMDAEQLAA